MVPRLVSSIYAHCADPMTEAEKDELARQSWRQHDDMVHIRLSPIKDDFERQAVINAATRQHGARRKRGNE